MSCQGEKSNAPAQPGGMTVGTEVTRLNIDCPDYATYPDGVTPVLGYMVYVSSVPGYSMSNMTQTDVGLAKIIMLNTIILGDGIWYVSASEYDARGSSGRSQNELKVEAKNGKFYL
jgi:hypothetical protein